MSLIAWHDRLNNQFQSLHQTRVSDGGGPIFALEHGLNSQEILDLETEVRTHIREFSPTDSHWLPWIVYAAELGYTYIGQEYWQTFEASTVGWRDRGRGRDWIRNKFKKFENDYGGAIPSGPWAEHFSIICHPITHAILPRDFQSQLAEVISTIQHLFTVENLSKPSLLGQLIESHSFQQRKRFQQFVQDVEMVGLIAQALLSDEEDQTSKILTLGTLQRIVEDLDGVARDQLQSARQRARVTELRGLSGRRGSRVLQPSERPTAEQGISISQPRIVLRRTSATNWEALLEMPDFTPYVARRPNWRVFIERTRAKVNRSTTWLSRGKLLFGSSIVPLRTCPESGKPLITFEDRDHTPDDLATFLERYFSFPTSGTLLCRIRSDGRAYQSRSLVVRPGRDYILLANAHPPKSTQISSPIEISCQGLFGVRLAIPSVVSKEVRVLIESLGLRIVEQVAIFPAGVAAAQWDEDGFGEWLVTDEICIGIRTDYWVEGLRLELNDYDGTTIDLSPEETGQALFLQLPPLSIGEYVLSAAGKTSSGTEYEKIGDLQIRVREPRAWKTAIAGQGALIPIFDPPKPSLEELLRGAVSVEIYGPEGHRMQVSASFFGKNSSDPIGHHTLSVLTLPITRSVGRSYLASLSQRTELLSAFDFAQSCRIDLRADELGTFSLSCEREFTPLRWVIKSTKGAYILSLSDDSGTNVQPSITHYEFASPDKPIVVTYKQTFENYEVPRSGGLYVASGPAGTCGIVFPHEIKGRIRSFAEMGKTIIDPKFKSNRSSIETLSQALRIFQFWTEARTTGSLVALLARQRVLRAYVAYILGMIAGPLWEKAELAYQANPSQSNAVMKLSSAVTDITNIKRNLENQSRVMLDFPPKERAEKLSKTLGNLIKRVQAPGVVGQFNVVSKSPRWQAEFALRLASAPETLQYWTQDWFLAGLTGLMGNQLLARASRFIVLTTSTTLQSTDRNQQSSLYAGWEWT